MNRVLVISYYFPPCNIVAAQRAKSFAENFKRHGLHPVIVTRHWTGDENSTAGYESENLDPPEEIETEAYTLIKLPYRAQLDSRFHRALLKTRPTKLVLYAFLYLFGTINPKCNTFPAFYDFLRGYLRDNPIDYILVTVFPMNTIKLGSRLAMEFNIPFIVDFRDLWDNSQLSANYRPALPERIQNFFYEFYLRRWLRKVRLISMVSEPLGDEIKKIAPDVPRIVVTNGYESSLFGGPVSETIPPKHTFEFSVIGTLEPKLDLSILLEGLRLFLRDKDHSQIRLNFIGADVFPEIGDILRKELPPEITVATGRIARDEAIRRMLRSHVLFHAGWHGYRGMASGKIYEYLGARRNVLIAPNDHDVMERMITETNAGKLADTPEQFAAIMNDWFEEWKANGTLRYRGDGSKIEAYTRENQAEKLAREILSL